MCATCSYFFVGFADYGAPRIGLRHFVCGSCPGSEMATFTYLCPNNGQRTQVRLRGGQSKQSYKPTTSAATICPACQHLHFVNPATGEILSVRHKYAKLRNPDWAA
jgi:hypothetical protein